MPVTSSVRELLESRVDADDYRIGGAANDAYISRSEALLAVQYPREYRRFLAEFGWMEIYNSYFFGVPSDPEEGEGSVVRITRFAQQQWGLPEGFVVVYSSDDQVLWCIDCRSSNEVTKVIAYDTRKRGFTGTVAQSYLGAVMGFIDQ